MLKEKSWYEFYRSRINSTYQNYFEERYIPFLKKLVSLNPKCVVDEGCGIGSVSKFLKKVGIKSIGFDLNRDVVQLARVNNGSIYFYVDNILKPFKTSDLQGDLTVTHGVLEHFSDEDILRIFERYKEEKVTSIHYVPLDKYKEPSFGDERLLSYKHWINLLDIKEFQLFNDNHDMWFIV